jgi:hypothetical protein
MNMESVFFVLWVVVCSATPLVLIWGWVRWSKRPKQRTVSAMLAMAGFSLAGASALLAVSSLIYGQAIGGFPYYDPRLLRIYRCGALLSLSGTIFGVGGVRRPNPLRWHAFVSAVGSLLFWVLAASGE